MYQNNSAVKVSKSTTEKHFYSTIILTQHHHDYFKITPPLFVGF